MSKKELKVAVIDLYNNEQNEGMRCIKEIVQDGNNYNSQFNITFDVFDTRFKNEIPDMGYNIFISSGGPGSPYEGENQKWDNNYFKLIDSIWNNNQSELNSKKYIFFVCHSFQMMTRYFKFAEITERERKSFGVLPIQKTVAGENDLILKDLSNPFYAADFRQFQVVNQNNKILNELGAEIIAYEVRPDSESNYENALMGIRISEEIVGTQFHPEADPESMMYHFKQPDRKLQIVERYDEKTYFEMIDMLEDPDKIKLTRKSVIPSFLNSAVDYFLNYYEIEPVVK